MTVADDLATLRRVADFDWVPGTREEHQKVIAAVDRVEAEIARLERENEHLHLRIQRKNESLNAAEAEEARLRDGLRLIPQKWQDVVLAEVGPR